MKTKFTFPLFAVALGLSSLTSFAQEKTEKHSHVQFHLAITTNDLDKSLTFYKEIFQIYGQKKNDHLGFVDFYGTIIAIDEDKDFVIPAIMTVDEQQLEVWRKNYLITHMHFGTVNLNYEQFDGVIERCKKAKVRFLVEPIVASKGKNEEQKFAFVLDPTGYIVEIRSMKYDAFTLKELNKYTQQDSNIPKAEL